MGFKQKVSASLEPEHLAMLTVGRCPAPPVVTEQYNLLCSHTQEIQNIRLWSMQRIKNATKTDTHALLHCRKRDAISHRVSFR